jgi:hypothetical protein
MGWIFGEWEIPPSRGSNLASQFPENGISEKTCRNVWSAV